MTVDVLILFHAVLKTAIPIAAGFIAAKLGMFDGEFSKKISALILKICQPVLIITSIMSVEYSRENLMTGLSVLLATLVAHLIMFAAAFGASRPIKDRKERAVSEYCMIFANAGFFGFPVVKSIYGDVGLFWGGFYYIIFNAALWSYGQFVFSRGADDGKINWKKILLNAGTVPCVEDGFQGKPPVPERNGNFREDGVRRAVRVEDDGRLRPSSGRFGLHEARRPCAVLVHRPDIAVLGEFDEFGIAPRARRGDAEP